jgi:hypothetical protein
MCIGLRRNSFNESSSPVRKDLKNERKRGGFRLFTSSVDGNLHTPARSAAAMGDLGTPVKKVYIYSYVYMYMYVYGYMYIYMYIKNSYIHLHTHL